jgi:hypothetical protein
VATTFLLCDTVGTSGTTTFLCDTVGTEPIIKCSYQNSFNFHLQKWVDPISSLKTLNSRLQGCQICAPNIPLLIYFGRPKIGRFSYISWPFGVFSGYLVYSMANWYSLWQFGTFFHVLVCCPREKSGNPVHEPFNMNVAAEITRHLFTDITTLRKSVKSPFLCCLLFSPRKWTNASDPFSAEKFRHSGVSQKCATLKTFYNVTYVAIYQICQIFLYTIYQNRGKYTKLPLHYQTAIKYTKWP